MRNEWKRVYMDARARLAVVGIGNTHLIYILFDMLYTGDGYHEALQRYAEFRGEAPEPLHSYLCGVLLRCGMEVGPGVLLSRLREEEVKNEDGVSIATGS